LVFYVAFHVCVTALVLGMLELLIEQNMEALKVPLHHKNLGERRTRLSKDVLQLVSSQHATGMHNMLPAAAQLISLPLTDRIKRALVLDHLIPPSYRSILT
jgi:hypothetical protein